MDPIRYFTVDFTGCKNWLEMQDVLKKALEFPSFYGRNLDALWDCLTGMMYVPAHITILGISSLRKDLREYGEKIVKICVEAQLEYGDITVSVPKDGES